MVKSVQVKIKVEDDLPDEDEKGHANAQAQAQAEVAMSAVNNIIVIDDNDDDDDDDDGELDNSTSASVDRSCLDKLPDHRALSEGYPIGCTVWYGFRRKGGGEIRQKSGVVKGISIDCKVWKPVFQVRSRNSNNQEADDEEPDNVREGQIAYGHRCSVRVKMGPIFVDGEIICAKPTFHDDGSLKSIKYSVVLFRPNNEISIEDNISARGVEYRRVIDGTSDGYKAKKQEGTAVNEGGNATTSKLAEKLSSTVAPTQEEPARQKTPEYFNKQVAPVSLLSRTQPMVSGEETIATAQLSSGAAAKANKSYNNDKTERKRQADPDLATTKPATCETECDIETNRPANNQSKRHAFSASTSHPAKTSELVNPKKKRQKTDPESPLPPSLSAAASAAQVAKGVHHFSLGQHKKISEATPFTEKHDTTDEASSSALSPQVSGISKASVKLVAKDNSKRNEYMEGGIKITTGLPKSSLPGVFRILREAGFVSDAGGDLDLDIDQLDTKTQLKIQSFVMEGFKTLAKEEAKTTTVPGQVATEEPARRKTSDCSNTQVGQSASLPQLQHMNPAGESADTAGQSDFWVGCSACDKWRMLPPDISDDEVAEIPDEWYCRDNIYDPERANCQAPDRGGWWMVQFYEKRSRLAKAEKSRQESGKPAQEVAKDIQPLSIDDQKALSEAANLSPKSLLAEKDLADDKTIKTDNRSTKCRSAAPQVSGGCKPQAEAKHNSKRGDASDVARQGKTSINLAGQEKGTLLTPRVKKSNQSNNMEEKCTADTRVGKRQAVKNEPCLSSASASPCNAETPRVSEPNKKRQKKGPKVDSLLSAPAPAQVANDKYHCRTPQASAISKPPTKAATKDKSNACYASGTKITTTSTVVAHGATSGILTDQQKKEKERFRMFTRVLMKYLEQRDNIMHAKAKAQIKECYEKNKRGDPAFKSITDSMKARLRGTVGEVYWKTAHDYLEHFLKQKQIAGATNGCM